MDKISIDELQDFNLTLSELQNVVNNLINKYGRNSRIMIDSGPNNASVEVEPQEILRLKPGTVAQVSSAKNVIIEKYDEKRQEYKCSCLDYNISFCVKESEII